jgi:hypothetical protein
MNVTDIPEYNDQYFQIGLIGQNQFGFPPLDGRGNSSLTFHTKCFLLSTACLAPISLCSSELLRTMQNYKFALSDKKFFIEDTD